MERVRRGHVLEGHVQTLLEWWKASLMVYSLLATPGRFLQNPLESACRSSRHIHIWILTSLDIGRHEIFSLRVDEIDRLNHNAWSMRWDL